MYTKFKRDGLRKFNALVGIFKKRQPLERPRIAAHINENGECISENGVAYKCKYSTHPIGGAWVSYVCPIHRKMKENC